MVRKNRQQSKKQGNKTTRSKWAPLSLTVVADSMSLLGLQSEGQSSNGFFKTFHLALLCSNT